MAHSVELSLPSVALSYSDAVFTVKADGYQHGDLHVSQGAVVWFPKGNQIGYKLNWQKFD
jgi:hypothetical protein